MDEPVESVHVVGRVVPLLHTIPMPPQEVSATTFKGIDGGVRSPQTVVNGRATCRAPFLQFQIMRWTAPKFGHLKDHRMKSGLQTGLTETQGVKPGGLPTGNCNRLHRIQ